MPQSARSIHICARAADRDLAYEINDLTTGAGVINAV